jgi:hypothetical protein
MHNWRFVGSLKTLLQHGMYFFTFHTEEPRDMMTSTDLLLIEHQNYQVFLLSVHILFRILFLSNTNPISWNFNTVLQTVALEALHFQKIFYDAFFYIFSKTCFNKLLYRNALCSMLHFIIFHNKTKPYHMHRDIHCSKIIVCLSELVRDLWLVFWEEQVVC